MACTSSLIFQILLCLLLLSLLVSKGWTLTFCKDNADCTEIGNLQCIKTKCSWGMCGCHRGKVARYLGSDRLYQCVDAKRIGDSCSLDGAGGVCGPDKSYCVNGSCECLPGYISRFNGELCAYQTYLFPSETATGSTYTCQGGSDLSPVPAMLVGGPLTCFCKRGFTTVMIGGFEHGGYQAKKIPMCIALRIGDTCLSDPDCALIQGSKAACKDNECVCNVSDHVPNMERNTCGKPLLYGAKCSKRSPDRGVCKGSEGLFCGHDVCDVSQEEAEDKCVCHHTFIKNSTFEGTKCHQRTVGSSCFGDENCKSLGRNAVCVDSKCKDGTTVQRVSLTLFLISLTFTLLK